MRNLRTALKSLARSPVPATSPTIPPDFGEAEQRLIGRVKSETMTSPERVIALRQAIQHVSARGIPGAIVECGVWRGGSMMAAAFTLLELDECRDLYLYDTFDGMTDPTDVDVEHTGKSALARMSERDRDDESAWIWARAGIDIVRANLESTGYDPRRVHLIEGRVEDTLPHHVPEQIAVLRLDTDWYESTRTELEHLFPRLIDGGILIIDDYGHWAGARRAVDEYLAELSSAPMLVRIDYTARLAIKGS